jgi:hypothetical protein
MTTERVLPAIALPVPGRATAQDGLARPIEHPTSANRNERYVTTPARAGILIGASAAVYAVTLAAVAGLQAADDAAIAERRQPYLDAVADGRAANDALEAAIGQAGDQARSLATSYALSADQLDAYESRLDALAALVAETQGSMAALPKRIHLPSVSIQGPIAAATRSSGGRSAAPAPRATTNTRASGG